MIEIPRILAHLLRTVLRRSVVDQEPKGEWPILTCRGDGTTLRLFAEKKGVGVSYDHASTHPPGELAFRSSLLSDIEGRSPAAVTFERLKDERGRARWIEGRLPRFVDFTLVKPTPSQMLAELPSRWHPLSTHFLASFDEAVQTSAQDSVRFALAKVQLRGKTGEIVSTDGKQLLVQSGFEFPWSEDVLVPKVRAFGIRDLAREGDVSIARTEKRVVIRVGPWTFALEVEDGRFPDTKGVIPRDGTEIAVLKVHPTDADFLIDALPKLPGHTDDCSAVTVDVGGGKAFVRARDRESDQTTQIELRRSTCKGKSARIAVDRKLLLRAMRLGCRTANIFENNTPLRFDGDGRTYVAMPLPPDAAVPPSDQATHVISGDIAEPAPKNPQPERTPMPPPNNNGHPSNGHSSNGAARSGRNGSDQERERTVTLDELVEEAEIFRRQLHELLGKVTGFLGNLKQHRRQSRAVHAAVQSIRDLKLGG